MDLTKTQHSQLNICFKNNEANRKAALGTMVVAFYQKQLFYGYIVERLDGGKIKERKQVRDIQWLVPVDATPYPAATLFCEDLNDEGHCLSDFVNVSKFHLTTCQDVNGNYALQPMRKFVASHTNRKRDRESDVASDAETVDLESTDVWESSESDWAPDSGSESGTDLLIIAALHLDKKRKRTYKTKAKNLDVYKQETNTHLATLGHDCRVLCNRRNSNIRTGALYLDSEAGCTTQVLHDVGGYHPEDLYCPNDSALVIAEMLATLRPSIRNTKRIHAKRVSIEQFTSKPSDKKFSYAWIDGMCTWQGSNGRCTRKAVLNLFRNKLLAPFAVVAYTASIRPKKGNREETAARDAERNFREIQACAATHGYLVSLQPELSQNKGMVNSDQIYTSWVRVYPGAV